MIIMSKDKEITKTNAARLLDSVGIAYELIPYSYSEDDLSAQSVAAELGEDIDMVFKTLVLRGDKNGIFVCVIPGDFEVDLKTAARLSGNKSCEMVHVKELLSLTGYIRGGCSPIGMKKQYPTFVHESALLYDYIYISAGQRGLQLKISLRILSISQGRKFIRFRVTSCRKAQTLQQTAKKVIYLSPLWKSRQLEYLLLAEMPRE